MLILEISENMNIVKNLPFPCICHSTLLHRILFLLVGTLSTDKIKQVSSFFKINRDFFEYFSQFIIVSDMAIYTHLEN